MLFWVTIATNCPALTLCKNVSYGSHKRANSHLFHCVLNFSRVLGMKVGYSPLFDKRRWLTVSEEKKSFFCFICVLFGGESNWTLTGIRHLKHLSEWVEKHEDCAPNIENDVKFNIFWFCWHSAPAEWRLFCINSAPQCACRQKWTYFWWDNKLHEVLWNAWITLQWTLWKWTILPIMEYSWT